MLSNIITETITVTQNLTTVGIEVGFFVPAICGSLLYDAPCYRGQVSRGR